MHRLESTAATAQRVVRIAVLGPFSLIGPRGSAAKLPKKAQVLLAFLALRAGQSVPREVLSTLLWGDRPTLKARQSLRQALAAVRAALSPRASEILVVDAEAVRLVQSPFVEIDAPDFEHLAHSKDRADLESAFILYRGELLAGLDLRLESLEEWISVERRRLASLRFRMLEKLAIARAESGDIDAAIAAAQELTTADPLREEGHRLLMRLLAEKGDRVEALRRHAHFVDILRTELGLAPDGATRRLAESIRQGSIEAPESPARVITPSPPASIVTGGTRAARPPADRPSIIVLPFVNLSGDAAKDYFADGITEDVTNALGRERWMFVIAAASAFALRSRAWEPLLVGSELGVRYVLRGSIRQDATRVRIVVQLTDGVIGGHLWSAHVEDELKNVFAVQDRLTAQVASMIAPAVRSAEIDRAQSKATDSLTAYDLCLRAMPYCRSGMAGNQTALNLLAEACALDPNYGFAYALAARCYHFQRMMGWRYPVDPKLQDGVRLAHTAVERKPEDSEVLWLAGLAIANIAGKLEQGLQLIDKSLSFNPNSANAWIASSFIRSYSGETDVGLAHFERARQLNPVDSTQHYQWHAAASALFFAGRYEEADVACDRTLSEMPKYPGALRLKVATSGLLGRLDEGSRAVKSLLAVNPDTSVAAMRAYWRDVVHHSPAPVAAFLDGCRRSGLPEEPGGTDSMQS